MKGSLGVKRWGHWMLPYSFVGICWELGWGQRRRCKDWCEGPTNQPHWPASALCWWLAWRPVLLLSLSTLPAIQMPSPCKSGTSCQQRQVLLEANESRENRNLKPWKMLEIAAYFLALQKSLALSGATPKCSTLGNGGASGDVPGCCLADNGLTWALASLAFEPRWKRANLEVIPET